MSNKTLDPKKGENKTITTAVSEALLAEYDKLAKEITDRKQQAFHELIAQHNIEWSKLLEYTQYDLSSLINALTILGAIGDITRFPSPKKLVGYAGLGGRVHDSGQTSRRGRITKAGRRDLRTAMVQAAQTASNTHPHWKAELERLKPRLGRNKAIVAIARKLLVSVWYVLAEEAPDRFAKPEIVARKLMNFAYTLGKTNRPVGQSTAQYVRYHLDRLGIGAELTEIPWGTKKRPLPLPPSGLLQKDG